MPKITILLKCMSISKPLVIMSYPVAEKTSISDVKGKQNLSTHRLKPVAYLSKEWSKWLAEPKSQSTGRILKGGGSTFMSLHSITVCMLMFECCDTHFSPAKPIGLWSHQKPLTKILATQHHMIVGVSLI